MMFIVPAISMLALLAGQVFAQSPAVSELPSGKHSARLYMRSHHQEALVQLSLAEDSGSESAVVKPDGAVVSGSFVDTRRDRQTLVQRLVEHKQLNGSFFRLISGKQGIFDMTDPLIAEVVSYIDAKMTTWQTKINLNNTECGDLAKQIISASNRDEVFQLHTGFMFDEGFGKVADANLKLRLSVFSALLTQPKAHINYWVNVGSNDSRLVEAFRPILQNTTLSSRLSIKQFNAVEEFTKASVPSLETVYVNEAFAAGRSDLLRATVLHNVGGIWFDADVLLIQDLSPLIGLDWAYFGQQGYINNAFLGVSEPGSSFSKAYLAMDLVHAVCDTGCHYAEFGPEALGELFGDLSSTSRAMSPGSAHILPSCFFDGGWSCAPGAAPWDEFFSRNATADEIRYAMCANHARDRFAFHWHGRWQVPVDPGSLAQSMYNTYLYALGIQP